MKKMSKKAYDRGGSVSVPQAPEEPDQRIDKMTGLPYDQQAGGAFVDEEDRLKFVAGGLRTIIKRLVRGVDDVVTDSRPVTRLNTDDGAKKTLRDLRYQEPENFIDPNSPNYSTTKVKADDEGKFVKYLREEEDITLNGFKIADDQDRIIRDFQLFDSANEFIEVNTFKSPNNRYWNSKSEVENRLTKELDDELNNIPEEDIGLVKKYTDDIPRVSDKPPESATVTKQEFLEGSTEKSPQYNGSFFSETRYDNPLSSAVPRELGFHVGTKGQAENILLRSTHPTAENVIERVAVRSKMQGGMSEERAVVSVSEEGVPDEIYDSLVKELNEIVPIGVEPKLQKGFINVKNPLTLDTDFINWNPSKFLGGSDLTGNLKLAEQADDFIKALDDQVNLPEAQFTKIVDDAAGQINSIVRKKDMNSGKLLNSAYDHEINRITKTMLEDLGFDSIKYKNLGELARASEKKAGGNSYILFREDQFKTDFVPPWERQPRTLKETIPEVQKAYDGLKAGNITADEYDRIVLNTIYPYEKVPDFATNADMIRAFTKKDGTPMGKRKLIDSIIEVGERIGLRLDIPAYRDHNVWIPTIHNKANRVIAHHASASIEDVDFLMFSKTGKGKSGYDKAQMIMEGEGKFPFAQMDGSFIPRTNKENLELAKQAFNSDDWIQVGYDPRRHSYFYDRVTGQPVASAEEVIQVGPLVLAKKATYADRSLFPYATGGKVLGGLKRTRRAEGGGIFESIGRWISKAGKELGFDDRRQLGISADATKITNRMVESGQLPETNRITWGVQQEGEADRIISPDELPEAGSRAKIGHVPNPDGSMQDEQPFDTINHALFGYESAESQKAKWGGQLKEVYQGIQESREGRNWRTEHKDLWNNQWGINQRQKGLTREEFDQEVINAILESQRKLEAGETLRMGKDLIIGPDILDQGWLPRRAYRGQ